MFVFRCLLTYLQQRSQDGALGSLFNAEMLPYMKYVLGERVWNRFIHGSSTKQEKKKVLDALEKILLRRRDQIGLLAVIKRHQENNERSLRSCISKKDPISTAEKLERLKSKICAVYNIVCAYISSEKFSVFSLVMLVFV